MSLQVSNSPTTVSPGRRASQVYQTQNVTQATAAAAAAATTGATTNGSRQQKGSKAAVDKQQQHVIVIDEDSLPLAEVVESMKEAAVKNVPPNVQRNEPQLPSAAAAAAKDESSKKATNGTNGAHPSNEKPAPVAAVTTAPSKNSPQAESPKGKKADDKKQQQQQQQQHRDGPRESQRSTPQKANAMPPAPLAETPTKQSETSLRKGKSTPLLVDPQLAKLQMAAVSSLTKERTFRGFGADGAEEMEPLRFDPSECDELLPAEKNSMVIRYMKDILPKENLSAGPSTIEQGGSPKADGEKNASQSVTSSPEFVTRPLRAISGRRAMRQMGDINLSHRRSYDQNESISSLNVTVGSEIQYDSLRTPKVLGSSRKRRDHSPEASSEAMEVKDMAVDSPKRARLDFSGFLGFVASPVTLLKNRFSRVKLHSTPVKTCTLEGSGDDDDGPSKVVPAEATTPDSLTPPTLPTADKKEEEGTAMEVEDAAAKVELQDATTKLPDGATAEDGSDNTPQEGDEVQVKDVTQNHRQWCNIM